MGEALNEYLKARLPATAEQKAEVSRICAEARAKIAAGDKERRQDERRAGATA